MRRTRSGTYIPALSRRDTAVVRVLTGLWVLAYAGFWIWWFQPVHRMGWAGLAVNSLLLFYFTYLPMYFLLMVNRLRRVDPGIPQTAHRVAFLVTRAPSEPWRVARQTLTAMLAQEYPHAYDVWLCDESPDEEVRAWCHIHGVRLSCREGRHDYHQKTWPRRTKCKEGNVAFFYDSWGYEHYDVVVQLDCDHVPTPGYLTEMVRPFSDPAVGYVAAPSMNDSNAASSWAARGRIHREAAFHGPVQLGHSDGLAPSCIGSHYAIRTRALKDIGGIGPELAEDFSTSFLLTSAGWRSAFVDTAEAHGEGPITFAAMVTQEFQWARSLMTLSIDLVPRHLRRLPWALRARFLFALSYYPLLSMATLGGLALPAVAAVDGTPWVEVHYGRFLAQWLAMDACLLTLVFFLRSRGMLRPTQVPLLSWEGWLYAMARWPYIAWGVAAAVVQKVRPTPVVFRVTPKSSQGLTPLTVGATAPYCVIALVMASASLVGQTRTDAVGYVFLCTLAAVGYSLVALAVPLLHAREAAASSTTGMWAAVRDAAGGAVMCAAAVVLVTVGAVAGFMNYVVAWS